MQVSPKYGTIKAPWWDDKPVAIIGGGPSLKDFDFERLRDRFYVLAVKASMFDIPWADAGFGLDMPRYKEWRDRLPNLQMRVYWAVPDDQYDDDGVGKPPGKNVTYLHRLEGANMNTDPSYIYGGGTSGFGALQVALHKKARRIVLFGYDYVGKYHDQQQDGFRHNDQHYARRRAQNFANWSAWAEAFVCFIPYINETGIKVFNACPWSQLRCFQKCTIEDGVNMGAEKVGV